MDNGLMMATKANHKLGDISREPADICVIHSEDENNFIGNWVTGYGFINVEFPKETTRELTEGEIEEYNGVQIAIGNGPGQIIETKENPIPMTAMKVVTNNSVYHFGKADKNGKRTIVRDDKPFDFKESVITFLAPGKVMRFYQADNPGSVWTTSNVQSIQ